MKLHSLRSWRIALLLLAVTAEGCGEGSNTVPVQGSVTYRGEPITGGAITFFPATGRPKIAAFTAQGDYSINLPPGDYTVAINVGSELPPGYKEGDPLRPPKIVLPPEYTTRAKTSLSAAVAPDQDEPINFELQ